MQIAQLIFPLAITFAEKTENVFLAVIHQYLSHQAYKSYYWLLDPIIVLLGQKKK